MLLNDGLIQVLRAEAYAQGSIGLMGVSEGRYPLSQMGDQSNDAKCDHVIQGVLYGCGTPWVPSSGHVRWGDEGVSMNDVCP